MINNNTRALLKMQKQELAKVLNQAPSSHIRETVMECLFSILREGQGPQMVHFLLSHEKTRSIDLISYSFDLYDHIEKCDINTFAAIFYQQPLMIDFKNQKVWKQLSKMFQEYKNGENTYGLFRIDVLINQPNLTLEDLDDIQQNIYALINLILEVDHPITYIIFNPMIKAACLVGSIRLAQGRVRRNKFFDIVKRIIKFLEEERTIYLWQELIETLIDIFFYEKPFLNNELNPAVAANIILCGIPTSYMDTLFLSFGMYLVFTKPFHDENQFKVFQRQLFITGANESNLTLFKQLLISMIYCSDTRYLVPIGSTFEYLLELVLDQTQGFSCLQLIIYIFSTIVYNLHTLGTEFYQYEYKLEIILKRLKILKSQSIEFENFKELMLQILTKLTVVKPAFLTCESIRLIDDLNSDYQISKTQLQNELNRDRFYLIRDFPLQPNSDPVGIRNIQNNCYFNSFLQCIFWCDGLREVLVQSQFITSQNEMYGGQYDLASSVAKMFTYLQKASHHTDFSPYHFKLALREPYRSDWLQQDAGEFGMQFLEDLQASVKQNQLIGEKMYQQFRYQIIGKSKCQLICQNKRCENTRFVQQELFIQISLNLNRQILSQQSQKLHIKDLIDQNSMTEIIEMLCEKCKQHVPHHKKIHYDQLPKYLIILLNRFKFNMDTQKQEKNMAEVKLEEFTLEKKKYQLLSFIVHIVIRNFISREILQIMDITTHMPEFMVFGIRQMTLKQLRQNIQRLSLIDILPTSCFMKINKFNIEMGSQSSCCIDRKERKDRLRRSKEEEVVNKITVQPTYRSFQHQNDQELTYAQTQSYQRSYLSSFDRNQRFLIVEAPYAQFYQESMIVQDEYLAIDQIVENPFRSNSVLLVYRQFKKGSQIIMHKIPVTNKAYLILKQIMNKHQFVGSYNVGNQLIVFTRPMDAKTEFQMMDDTSNLEEIINDRAFDKLECRGLIMLGGPVLVLQSKDINELMMGFNVVQLDKFDLGNLADGISKKIETLCQNDEIQFVRLISDPTRKTLKLVLAINMQ